MASIVDCDQSGSCIVTVVLSQYQDPPDFLILQIILDYYGLIDFFLIRDRDFYGLLFEPWVPKNL